MGSPTAASALASEAPFSEKDFTPAHFTEEDFAPAKFTEKDFAPDSSTAPPFYPEEEIPPRTWPPENPAPLKLSPYQQAKMEPSPGAPMGAMGPEESTFTAELGSAAARGLGKAGELAGNAWTKLSTPLGRVPGVETIKQVLFSPFQIASDISEGNEDGGVLPGLADKLLAVQPPEKALDITSGAAAGAAETLNFFTSPLGVATLGTGILPKAAQRVVAGAFATQMASSLPELWSQLKAQLDLPEDQRDYKEISRLTTGGAATLGFTAASGFHAVRGLPLGAQVSEPFAGERSAPEAPASREAPTPPVSRNAPAAGPAMVMPAVARAAPAPPVSQEPPTPPAQRPEPTGAQLPNLPAGARPGTAELPPARPPAAPPTWLTTPPTAQPTVAPAPSDQLVTPGDETPAEPSAEKSAEPNATPTAARPPAAAAQQPGLVRVIDAFQAALDELRAGVPDAKKSGETVNVPEKPKAAEPAAGAGAGPFSAEDFAAGNAVASAPAAAPRRIESGPTLPLAARSDGQPDILDAIAEQGGIAPPGPDAGGEYDGHPETLAALEQLFPKSFGRLARNPILRNAGGLSVDKMIDALQGIVPGEEGEWKRIKTPDDLWNAIGSAVKSRVKIKEQGGGKEAQLDRFWAAASAPDNPKGMVQISVDKLKVGDRFRLRGPGLSNEELEVTGVDPDNGTVTVKDGTKIGYQDLPEGAQIWVQKRYAPQHALPTDQERYDAIKARRAAQEEVGNAPEPEPASMAAGQADAPAGNRPMVERTLRNLSRQFPNAPKVTVLEHPEEFPEAVKRDAAAQGVDLDDARAAWHKGQIYMAAANLPTPHLAARTFLHEAVGHAGVEQVLGKNAGHFLAGVLKRYANSPLLDDIRQRYPGADAPTLAKEILAHLAERPALDPSLWSLVVAKVRAAARALGIQMQVSEADVQEILRRAFKRQGGSVANARNEARSYGPEPAQPKPAITDDLVEKGVRESHAVWDEFQQYHGADRLGSYGIDLANEALQEDPELRRMVQTGTLKYHGIGGDAADLFFNLEHAISAARIPGPAPGAGNETSTVKIAAYVKNAFPELYDTVETYVQTFDGSESIRAFISSKLAELGLDAHEATAALRDWDEGRERIYALDPGLAAFIEGNTAHRQYKHGVQSGHDATVFATGGKDFHLDAPESVADQKARLKREATAEKLKAANEDIGKRAAAPLTAKPEDKTAEMFGNTPETRIDKKGQGSLFAAGAQPGEKFPQLPDEDPKAVLDRHALHFYGQPYDRLPGLQQKAIMDAVQNQTLPRRLEPKDVTRRNAAPDREPELPATIAAPQKPAARPGKIPLAEHQASPTLSQADLDYHTRELHEARLELAQSPHNQEGPAGQLAVGALGRVRYHEGVLDTLEAGHDPADIERRIAALHAEAQEHQRTRSLSPVTSDSGKSQLYPATRSGIGAFASQRYIDGQVDALRDIQAKAAEPQPTLFSAGQAGGETGGSQRPAWETRDIVGNAAGVARAAMERGRSEEDALLQAAAWIHHHFNTEDFDWAAAKSLVREALHPQADWEKAMTARDEASKKATDLSAQFAAHGGSRDAPAELKDAYNKALFEARELARKLRGMPGYVEHLLSGLKTESDPLEVEKLRGELAMIEPTLLNRTYAAMQERGDFPKSKPLPEPYNSLQKLTEWLRNQKIDSPKRTMAERLDLAQKAADIRDELKLKGSRAWLRTVATAHAMAEQFKHPPVDDDPRKLVKGYNLSLEQSNLETAQWMAEVRRKVENPLRRQAIMAWIHAGGDEELLRDQAPSVPEKFKPIWDTAQKLTEDEKSVANQVRGAWAQSLEDAKNAGLLEEGRENYAPIQWARPPKLEVPEQEGGRRGTPNIPSAKLDTRDPFFSFHRETPTLFDGLMAGGVPDTKTMDVASALGFYNMAFNQALRSRAFVKAGLDAQVKDGHPMVILSGRADAMEGQGGVSSKGYVVDSRYRGKEAVTKDGRPYLPFDHPALKDWKFVLRTDEGKPILARADMLIHPDVLKYFKAMLGTSPIREYALGRGLLSTSRFLKESVVAASPFHAATLAEHAASHTVNPFSGERLDLTQPKQAGLVRGGLGLGFADSQMDFMEGMGTHEGAFGWIPGLGQMANAVSHATFKQYLPWLKMNTALHILERNLARYGGEGKGKLTEDQIYDLSASQANAAFGLQNYRLLGRSPFVRDLLSLGAFAPDFLISRAKFVGQALKPYGAEQRRALLVQAAGLYVVCRAIQTLVDPDHDPHLGWRDAFSVVYQGRRYSIRTVIGDVWHLATDPRSFAYGRISQPVRIGTEALTGKDWRGMNRTGLEQVDDALRGIAPMWLQGMLPGAKGREDTLLSAAGKAFGLGSRKDTAGMRVSELAKSFNRNSPDPAARSWQKQKDQETLPESDFGKLTAALEDNNLRAAERELEKLLASGHTSAAIFKHYRNERPFTGTKERENDFYDSLTPKQQEVYERARQERSAVADRFNEVWDRLTDKEPVETP